VPTDTRGMVVGDRSEAGFTLVELLIVVLLLGILATIALPSFFNQRAKADDASAKTLARSAEIAMETYGTSNGAYTGATAAALKQLEPALTQLKGSQLTVKTPQGKNLYRLRVRSKSGNRFDITRTADGSTVYACTAAHSGGCPAAGRWG
jgi:prepilin-type N-terminal cleavage/methylation domain-containing protein